jgi:hypothetical protein
MRKPILAIFAFNIYASCLIGAFQVNTAYLFETDLIEQLRGSGLDVSSPSQWGWGDHYIWRLFAGAVVTALVGLLAGAIAKEGAARIAALANIPSMLVWVGMVYLFGFADVELEARMGFLVISITAIPLTTYIAYVSGGLGEDVQRQNFRSDTVLGIKGYHWIWIIFPLYLYALGIIYSVTKLLLFEIASFWNDSIFTTIVYLIMLLPLALWIIPLWIVYLILRGDLISNHNAAVRAMANFGVLTIGLLVAGSVPFGVYWLLSEAFA